MSRVNVGDIVKAQSSPRRMTVVKIERGSWTGSILVDCRWDDRTASFYEQELEIVKKAAPSEGKDT